MTTTADEQTPSPITHEEVMALVRRDHANGHVIDPDAEGEPPLPPEPPDDDEPPPSRRKREPIQWADFLSRDLSQVDWLPGRLLSRGQLIALVGDGKAGKSVLSQEWAWRASAGLPFLGDQKRKPVRVLYGDLENSDDDVQERMLSFGATSDQLANLIYLPFPTWRPLDTREGGEDLLADVEEHRAELVFLDTISRMIKGKENDSDTWLDLYRYTLARLKRRGVSVVRLDHFGKDKERGARGNSAKTQDVDHVWELTAQTGGLLRLNRTHTRTGHGDGDIQLRRQGRKVNDRWVAGETRHVLAAEESGQPTTRWVAAQAIAQKLDDAGVPREWGRDRVSARGKELGITVGKTVWEEVVRLRKGAENLPGAGLPDDLGESALDYRGNW